MSHLIEDFVNIILFDDSGNPYPVKNNEGLFSTNVNLKKHGQYIPEHTTIYLMEKVLSGGSISLNSFTNDKEIIIKISGEGYSLYDIDDEDFITNNNELYFSKKILEREYTEYNGKKYVSNYISDNNPLQINLVNIGNEEKIYEGKLEIFNGEDLLYSISLYTEVEEEDERFINLLENIGEYIGNKHEIIFRNSDINEDLPNPMLLNDKRKEFLTVINDITPYISSVDGILQIIDFFDYKNVVEVKEYWYDPISDRIRIVPITDIYKDTRKVKLNQFGLFYKINEPTDQLDALGLPVLKDNFIFTHQEVLIKLFALRNYFIEKDYGGISDIVDVIGEIYNFNRLTIRSWKTSSDNLEYNQMPVVKFEFDKEEYFIEPITDECEHTLEPYQTIEDLKDYKIYEIGKHNFVHFKGYFMEDVKVLDSPFQKVGAKVKLINKTFKNSFSDASFNFKIVAGVDLNWNNLFNHNFYSIRYRITRHPESIQEDGNTYNRIFVGNGNSIHEFEVILPYNGWYNVEMIMVGYNGMISSLYKEKALFVNLADPNFMFLFRITDPDLQSYVNNDNRWNDINQAFFEEVNFNRNLESVHDLISPNGFLTEYWNSIDRRIKKQRYFNSEYSFKDVSLTTFRNTEFESRKINRFVYSGIIPKSYIQFNNEEEYRIPEINVNEYNHLEKLFKNNLPYDYEYTHYERINHNLIEGVYYGEGREGNRFIGSSERNIFAEKQYETFKDFDKEMMYEVGISFRCSRRIIKTEYTPNAFTVSNSKVFYDEVSVPLTVPLFMTLWNSKVYGKENCTWEIYDENDNLIQKNTGLVQPILINKIGHYSVKIRIVDNNGNVYNRMKRNIISVESQNEYKNNYRYAHR